MFSEFTLPNFSKLIYAELILMFKVLTFPILIKGSLLHMAGGIQFHLQIFDRKWEGNNFPALNF